ncbi:MAG: hypothetical protein WBB48_07855 [Thermodesulfobacteriota bacterium]
MTIQIEKFTSFIFIALLVALLSFSISIASAIDEEEVQLPEPQGACSSDPCSPASPCPSKDEKCYSSNGVFYCCVLPPFPGAEAVGD